MIVINLDVEMAKNKIRSKDLAKLIGISEIALSNLKNGKVKGIRFSTLNKICKILNCMPGDILGFNDID